MPSSSRPQSSMRNGIGQLIHRIVSIAAARQHMPAEPPRPCGGRLRIHFPPPVYHNGPRLLDVFCFAQHGVGHASHWASFRNGFLETHPFLLASAARSHCRCGRPLLVVNDSHVQRPKVRRCNQLGRVRRCGSNVFGYRITISRLLLSRWGLREFPLPRNASTRVLAEYMERHS